MGKTNKEGIGIQVENLEKSSTVHYKDIGEAVTEELHGDWLVVKNKKRFNKSTNISAKNKGSHYQRLQSGFDILNEKYVESIFATKIFFGCQDQ